MLSIFILDTCLKITNLGSQLHLPGANEFKKTQCGLLILQVIINHRTYLYIKWLDCIRSHFEIIPSLSPLNTKMGTSRATDITDVDKNGAKYLAIKAFIRFMQIHLCPLSRKKKKTKLACHWGLGIGAIGWFMSRLSLVQLMNGLSPIQHQAITGTNADLLSSGLLENASILSQPHMC